MGGLEARRNGDLTHGLFVCACVVWRGVEERNVAAAVVGALSECRDVYTRARLARCVVLVGGGCSVPGFAARLVEVSRASCESRVA